MVCPVVNRQRAVVQIVKNFVNSYSSDGEEGLAFLLLPRYMAMARLGWEVLQGILEVEQGNICRSA
jgi:ActR/RegA family two-component response regulator